MRFHPNKQYTYVRMYVRTNTCTIVCGATTLTWGGGGWWMQGCLCWPRAAGRWLEGAVPVTPHHYPCLEEGAQEPDGFCITCNGTFIYLDCQPIPIEVMHVDLPDQANYFIWLNHQSTSVYGINKVTHTQYYMCSSIELVTEWLTSCQCESPVEVKGHQRLLQFSQEVLEDTTDDMDVIHLGQVGLALPLEELLLQLFDLGVTPAWEKAQKCHWQLQTNVCATVPQVSRELQL